MTRILDVIGANVELEQGGDDDYRGFCPFHRDTAPTFYVVPSQGIFHCFGCGMHGDVISFVMRQRKLNFSDAVYFIAGGLV